MHAEEYVNKSSTMEKYTYHLSDSLFLNFFRTKQSVMTYHGINNDDKKFYQFV